MWRLLGIEGDCHRPADELQLRSQPRAAFAAGFAPYDAIRVALAFLLLTAAALKGHQIATGIGGLTSNRFQAVIVVFELALGFWLLSGLYSKQARYAALVCFLSFCGISAYRGLAGKSSCGCLGAIAINPWLMASVDAIAALGLFCTKPPIAVPNFWKNHSTAVISIVLVTGLLVALLTTNRRVSTLSESGEFTNDSEVVVLTPETWIEKRFPLSSHIDVGDRLLEGEWSLLFYHHDCSQCRDAITYYRQFIDVDRLARSSNRTALIEMRPLESAAKGFATAGSYVHGVLDNERHWIMEVPTLILLNEGKVVGVKQTLDGIKESESSLAP